MFIQHVYLASSKLAIHPFTTALSVASLLDNHHDRFSRAESHDHFFFLLKLAFFTRCLFSPFSCLLVFRMLVNSARRFGEIVDGGSILDILIPFCGIPHAFLAGHLPTFGPPNFSSLRGVFVVSC